MSNSTNFHRYTDIEHHPVSTRPSRTRTPGADHREDRRLPSRVGLLLVDGEWRFVAGSRSRVEEP